MTNTKHRDNKHPRSCCGVASKAAACSSNILYRRWSQNVAALLWIPLPANVPGQAEEAAWASATRKQNWRELQGLDSAPVQLGLLWPFGVGIQWLEQHSVSPSSLCNFAF